MLHLSEMVQISHFDPTALEAAVEICSQLTENRMEYIAHMSCVEVNKECEEKTLQFYKLRNHATT
jgi:hypothetical protein